MKQFIAECEIDAGRFSKPIRRNTIRNFTNEIGKTKGPSQKKYINETKYERSMLAQIFCLAYTHSVDLNKVLSYPLTSVPRSLAHEDGTMNKNSKKNELISLISPSESEEASSERCDQSKCGYKVEIIDGNYLFNQLKNTPTKYGLFAEFLLKTICNTNALEIHVCFEKNSSPCLNDLQAHTNILSSSIKINGGNQERPFNLSKCLSHDGFKDELIQFIIKEWSKSETYEIIGDKRIFFSFGKYCYVFTKNTDLGKAVNSLNNNHMEVESKIILHLCRIRENHIKIRASDPEKMLTYLIYNSQFFTGEKNICLEFGDVYKNSLQHINVTNIYKSLDPIMVKSLPAFFNFTGSSFEPAFYGKGRKSWFKHFDREIQVVFSNIGVHSPSIECISSIEKYVCKVYNIPCERVNEARVQMFWKTYAPSKGIDFSKKGLIYISLFFINSELKNFVSVQSRI